MRNWWIGAPPRDLLFDNPVVAAVSAAEVEIRRRHACRYRDDAFALSAAGYLTRLRLPKGNE
jgi:hypothetical protein